MKPSPFAYARPNQLSDVVACLVEWGDDAKVIAGGQSLIPLLNLRLAHPAVLVDVSAVEGLTGISAAGAAVAIRAATRQRDAERSPEVAAICPLIGQALHHVGHAQIRNRGTVGGNLAHGDAASELPAVAVALGAEFVVEGPAGERRFSAEDFFVGAYTTALGSDDVLTEIRFPATPGCGTAFLELARRRGDYALAGVAACVRVDEKGNVTSARLAACGVGSVPFRLRQAEAAITGRSPDAEALREASEAASAEVDPPSDIHGDAAYRRRLVGTLVRRAIEEADRVSGPPVPVDNATVALVVNGEPITVSVPARRLLLDCLRDELGLVGTHAGCEHGVCGACTVLVDGEPVRSCLMLAVQAEGRSITTVEGLGALERTADILDAFAGQHGLQCGFCTPGFLVTIAAADPADYPDDDSIRDLISGNLCRCTGYHNIVLAVRQAWSRNNDV